MFFGSWLIGHGLNFPKPWRNIIPILNLLSVIFSLQSSLCVFSAYSLCIGFLGGSIHQSLQQLEQSQNKAGRIIINHLKQHEIGDPLNKDHYIRIAREKAISDGSISPDDALDTRIPFHREAWQAAVVSFYESKGKRVKRGDRIFGFGPHGKKFLKLPSSSRSSSSLCQSLSQTSNPFDDPEKEQLREEVSSLKEMMHQMMEREKERDQREQQQQEEQRQKQQQYQQWHIQQMMGGGGGPYQNQQRFNPNWSSPGFMSCIPPSGMFIPQQQQSFQQHISHGSSSNQCGVGTGIGIGTGPILDMLLDSNFNFVGDVSGNGGVGGGVCGTRGEGGSTTGSGNEVEI